MSIYQDFLNNEDLTLKVYRGSYATFQGLANWQKAVLAIIYPSLMLEMLKNKQDHAILLNTHDVPDLPRKTSLFDMKIIGIDECPKAYRDHYSKINSLSFRTSLHLYRDNEEISTAVYENPELFNSLKYNIHLISLHPDLQRRIIIENRLQDLRDTEFSENGLSSFITRLIFSDRKLEEQALNDRNALCIAIAKQPNIVLRLLPMTRLFLLSALKTLSPENQNALPTCIQEALEQAYDLPLEDRHIYNFNAFWLPTIAGIDKADCWARFHETQTGVLVSALQQDPDIYPLPEALALGIVLDPRFEKGYPNTSYPDHPWAKLKETEKEQLIAKHNLTEKINAYNKLSVQLNSLVTGQDAIPSEITLPETKTSVVQQEVQENIMVQRLRKLNLRIDTSTQNTDQEPNSPYSALITPQFQTIGINADQQSEPDSPILTPRFIWD